MSGWTFKVGDLVSIKPEYLADRRELEAIGLGEYKFAVGDVGVVESPLWSGSVRVRFPHHGGNIRFNYWPKMLRPAVCMLEDRAPVCMLEDRANEAVAYYAAITGCEESAGSPGMK